MTSAGTAPQRGGWGSLGLRKPWEAADTILVSSLVLVGAIVGIFVVLCFQGYSTTIEESKARAQRAADVVAEGSRWVIASARASLEAAAPGDGAPASLVKFEEGARHLPAKLALGIYDASGRLVGPQSTPGVAAEIADRDYFARLVAGDEWALGSQELLAAGSSIFAVAKPLRRGDVFDGAAVVFVDGGVLEGLAAPQDLGAGSTISIVRDDGWVVARNPPLSRSLDLSTTTAMATLRGGQAGAYESQASPVDGVPRLVGFKHVPDLGYIALASVSTETVLGGLWHSIWIVSLLLAPIGLALLAGSFLTARLLRRTQADQRSIAHALEHNEALFKEIHHRVKNNLQSINSLLQIHPIPREVRADMSKRIFAMSAVHEHIYRTSNFRDVRVRDYLHTLIGNIREGADPRVSVTEELDDVIVDKDAAAALGLILNEVLSNAFKHAFIGREGGSIKVELKAQPGGDRARLMVHDDGPGFDESIPAKGIGRRLVAGFAAQLGGQITHSQENGHLFTLDFPGRLAASSQ